jgi:hypothetical protein
LTYTSNGLDRHCEDCLGGVFVEWERREGLQFEVQSFIGMQQPAA